jgi:hypothetical protein
MEFIQLLHIKALQKPPCDQSNEPFGFIKGGEGLEQMSKSVSLGRPFTIDLNVKGQSGSQIVTLYYQYPN